MASARADAGKTTGGSPMWELPRSPFVPHRATPSALECEIDEDDDGLDDEIEGLLADRFVPILRFATGEQHLKVGPQFPGGQEPFVAFNAWPEKAAGKLRVSIKYATLYANDGGYFDHWPAGQGADSHVGDSSFIQVKLELTEKADGRWVAELVQVDASGQHWNRDKSGSDNATPSCYLHEDYIVWLVYKCSPPGQVETLKLDPDGHPFVLASWGKHHYYLNVVAEFVETYHVACLPVCGTPVFMSDLADGGGPAIRPKLQMKYPSSTSDLVWTNVGDVRGPGGVVPEDWAERCSTAKWIYAQACDCDPAGGTTCPPPAPATACIALSLEVWRCDHSPPTGIDLLPYTPTSNCKNRRFPPGPHPTKFIANLTFIYPGESFSSGDLFCGGALDDSGCESASLPEVVGRVGEKNLDTDGDGLANFDDPCPTRHSASFDHSDADGDGVGKACDPNPKYRDTWIGPGFPLQNLRAFKSVSGSFEDPKRRGWLDTDQDSITNGADFCPATAGGTADQLPNWNLWAEKSVFVSDIGNATYAAYHDDGKDLSPYRPKPVDTGFVERGSLCDPYETTKIWQQPAYASLITGDVCHPLTQYGAPKIQVDAVPLRGVSSNDLVFSGKTYAQRLEEAKKHGAAVRVDPRRCACSAFDKSPAVREVVCFDKQTGQCPRTSPLVSTSTDVTFWFAHEYPNCARTTQPMFGGSRCLPFPTTAPVAASAFCPPGQTCPKVPGDLTPKVHHLGWDWMIERANYPGHFRPEWFQSGTDPFGEGFAQATVGFTFATRTFLDGVIPGTTFPQDSDLFSPKAKTFNRSVGQHADVNPWIRSDDATKSESKLSAQDKLRRTGSLRTHFSESFAQPSEPHRGLNKNPPSECSHIYDTPQDQTVWLIPFNKCIPIEKCFDKLGQAPWALVKSTVEPAATKLVELGSGLTQAVQVVLPGGGLGSLDCLASDCGPPGVGSGWQIAALPGGLEDGGLPRLVAAVSGRARSDGIADDAGDRFWVLAPVGVDQSVVVYSVVASGSAPVGTSRADAFLGSDDGSHVVAFFESRSGAPGWLRVLDVEATSWVEVALEHAVPARANAAYVVREHGLYRAGGEAGGALTSEVSAIDWRSGRFETIVAAGQLPPRARPHLSWDVQGEGLIYGGGVGADGAAHDDLWSVRAGHGVAVRLVADTTPLARPLDPSGLVVATGFAGEAILWDAPSYVAGIGVRHSVRRSELGGWVEADVVTKAARARTCADGSSARRCASGADWWRTPGTTCASGICELGRTEQAAASVVLPGATAREIALEHSTLWIARGSKVERWSLLDAGSGIQVGSVDLGGPVTAIAARDGVVVAATAKQVARVAMVDGALQVLQSAIPVCRSESITSIGLRGWLIATSDGAALLQANETGALEVTSEIELAMVKGKWSAIATKKSGKQCTLPPSAGGKGEDLPSRVAFDGKNVELAHGNDVFRLGWDASGQLALVDVTSVTGKILDLRATPDRAYLVGKHPHQKTDLGVLLLGAAMTLDGQHDVADWVEGEQSGPYRARVTPSGSVEVAWLAQ